MAVVTKRNVISGLKVSETMRRQVVSLVAGASLDRCIRNTIKYKVNAILVTDKQARAVGVVSKTDLMGAYYAGLPLDSPVESIMVGPPLFCRPGDRLEKAMEYMLGNRIHRLYVTEDEGEPVVGVLAYPDIVGLLYRYCAKCKRNIGFGAKASADDPQGERILAREVMTSGVKTHGADETLYEVMEGLAEYKFGAVLIVDDQGQPAGVLSKTDLIIAYRHGMPPETAARTIMSASVKTCRHDDLLSDVIRRMILSDVHRLFVRAEGDEVVGVVSLTDAARVRSGSCRACTTSRFIG